MLYLRQDLICGILFVAIGAATLLLGAGLPVGSLSNFGPGMFPRIIGCGLIGCGIYLTVQDLIKGGDSIEDCDFRAVAMVALGIAMFGLLVDRAGLLVALLTLTACAMLAAPGRTFPQYIVVSSILSGIVIALFVGLLGVNAKVFPWN